MNAPTAPRLVPRRGYLLCLLLLLSSLLPGVAPAAPRAVHFAPVPSSLSRLGLGPEGAEPNAPSNHIAISGDGSVVAYHSQATSIVKSDANGSVEDVFVVDSGG